MSLIPPGLAHTLDTLAEGEPFALYLRHADREAVPAGSPWADVDLTPRGLERAASLAARLTSVRWAAVSPWLRCRRTAQAFGGVGIEDDSRLGSPGPWVLDREAGSELFSSLGTEGVVRAQIAGKRWEFIRSAPEGTALLLSLVRERMASGTGICVSHDAVLMPAIAHLFEERFEGGWLDPLDGFAVQATGGVVRALFRGKAREISW